MIGRAASWFVGGLLAACAAAGTARANGIFVEPSPAGGPRARPPVVLATHRVVATVRGRVAHVEVEQVFVNRSDAVLEGVYLFPLPDGALVQGFAMSMGDRTVEGQVVPAAQARAYYESIVRRRRDPGLLEYAGRGLYRASVFPIPGLGRVRVRLSFEEMLPEDAGTLEFRYPLATDRLNGEPVEEVSLDVRIEADADLKAVYSPSHAVETTREGARRARVAWRRTAVAADRDFLLYVGRSAQAVGFSLVSAKPPGEEGTFLAVLAPRIDPREIERVPKDVVFVLDTSASMAGRKIEAGRRAVAMGIERLRPGDRFDVLTFDSSVDRFREGFVPADDSNRAEARAWLAERGADGSTYIEMALLTALSLPSEGRLMMVVFVTDGLPSLGETDPDVILGRALACNPSKARVYTFGVGSDLDVGLLDRLAEGTGGAREYVTSGEDLEIATGRLYAKVDQPVMTDVEVDLGPGVHDVYPARLPDLFAGSQAVLFGRYKEAGPRRVRLRGKVAGKPVEFSFDGDLRSGPGPTFLERLWAQRKVAFLLDAVRLHGEDREVVHEIEDLATRFAILTPYTSGLVVDPEEATGAGAVPAPPRARRTGRGVAGAGGSVPPGLREPVDPIPPSGLATPPATLPTLPQGPSASKGAGDPMRDSMALRRAWRRAPRKRWRGRREPSARWAARPS